MKSSSGLFKLVLFAGFAGWLFEYVIDGEINYMVFGGRPIRIPFNFAYSLGAIVWYALWSFSRSAKMGVGSRVLLYAAGLTIFEWVLGVLTAYTNGGKPLWNYNRNSAGEPSYVAITPTLIWVAMALGLEWVFS